MPVHDWTRVDAGTFHAFHTAWITHLSEALNEGLLPPGYYALPEQHGGRLVADVLTLQVPPPAAAPPLIAEGGVAVAETPPQVRRRLSPSPAARGSRRTLAIRHVSGRNIVALVEIVSPANKDRAVHVAEFADKEHLAVGAPLADMPLFLNPEHYINVPLEPTYTAAYRGMPAFWRDVLEGRR